MGTVLIGRWYWWRLNAWSELTATLVPIVLAVIDGCLLAADIHVAWITEFPGNLYFFVVFTTLCWVLVTFQTEPVSYETLDRFYRTVRVCSLVSARAPRTLCQDQGKRHILGCADDDQIGIDWLPARAGWWW